MKKCTSMDASQLLQESLKSIRVIENFIWIYQDQEFYAHYVMEGSEVLPGIMVDFRNRKMMDGSDKEDQRRIQLLRTV